MKILSVKLLAVLALGLIICLPGAAYAWSSLDQGWYDNYPEGGPATLPIDTLDFFIMSGTATFDAVTPLGDYGNPGFAGWTVQILSPTEVIATNFSAPTSATWYYLFDGASPVANYTLAWNGYYDGTFQYGEIDQLANGGLTVPPPGYYFNDAPVDPPVPLPSSILLLGSGLFGLGLLGWRRKTS